MSLSLVLLLLAGHPIHTSVLELAWDARSRAITGTLRVFEDDLSLAARSARQDASAYALGRVHLRSAAGPIALEGCGTKRVADAVLLCVRGTATTLRGLYVRNTVLMDLHDDQINIVRVQGPRSRTLLLTATAPEQAVEP